MGMHKGDPRASQNGKKSRAFISPERASQIGRENAMVRWKNHVKAEDIPEIKNNYIQLVAICDSDRAVSVTVSGSDGFKRHIIPHENSIRGLVEALKEATDWIVQENG